MYENYGELYKNPCSLWKTPVVFLQCQVNSLLLKKRPLLLTMTLITTCVWYQFINSPPDWSAWGNLDTEFCSVASFDFMILRPSLNRISWPFRNFSIWRSTPTTWCLSMHVCEHSTSNGEQCQGAAREPWQSVTTCSHFPTSKTSTEIKGCLS